MLKYTLAPHAYACYIDEIVILLDVRTDKYFGVSAQDAFTLTSLVEGWPALPATTRNTGQQADDEAVLTRMLKDGFICESSPKLQARKLIKAAAPLNPLIDGYDIEPYSIKAIDVVRFLVSSAVASLTFRLLSFHAIVKRATARATRMSAHISKDEIALLRRHVAVYFRLRPLLFRSHNRCLFDSLALSLFLFRYKLRPQWVFGVATVPFGSHCWLQYADIVINDEPEHAAKFTQIMVI